MGNVSKQQQPDYRAENSRRTQMGIPCNIEIPIKDLIEQATKRQHTKMYKG